MKTILIVDNAVALRETVSLVLQLNGFNTTTASSEKELHDYIGKKIPDLVLLDMHLGASETSDICYRLKTSFITWQVPVILMSSHSRNAHTYREHLANDFLEKPFHLHELISKVQFHLQQTLQAS